MKQFLINNRKKVLEKLENNCALILFAGKAPVSRGDQHYPFAPDRNFYYLTGIDRENLIYLAFKNNENTEEYIFIERYDEVKAKWDGSTICEEKTKEISGIENIKFLDEFEQIFSRVFFRNSAEILYLDLENRYFNGFTPAFEFTKKFKENYPYANIKNVYNIIGNLRLLKEDFEIESMKKAINITQKGIENILKNAKPNMAEYELEAYFDFELKRNGVKEKAFQTILAGGKNATILHYSENNSNIEDNNLVLLDLGASYNYYSADISRTFPINGKFSERQKQFYNIVLEAQKKVIEAIKPGIPMKNLNQIVIEHYKTELKNIGLIKEDSEVSKYYYHGVSHFLGLETHDITGNEGAILKEGMVITVEPGIYIAEEGIGIRIEDDILVTKNGSENLSKNILKTVEEIEQFMQNK